MGLLGGGCLEELELLRAERVVVHWQKPWDRRGKCEVERRRRSQAQERTGGEARASVEVKKEHERPSGQKGFVA